LLLVGVGGLVVWLAQGAGAPATGTGDAAPREPARLTVRVLDRGGRSVEVENSAALRTGTMVRVEGRAPAEAHAALFLCTGGKLRRLASAGPEERSLSYPAAPNKAAPLTGPDGTELVLLCVRRSGPIEDEEVGDLLGGLAPLPLLPGMWVLRLGREGVEELQRGRDLGPPQAWADPAGEVARRLEEVRPGLRERFDDFVGLAFAHRR
jgi:hypothetical protein